MSVIKASSIINKDNLTNNYIVCMKDTTVGTAGAPLPQGNFWLEIRDGSNLSRNILRLLGDVSVIANSTWRIWDNGALGLPGSRNYVAHNAYRVASGKMKNYIGAWAEEFTNLVNAIDPLTEKEQAKLDLFNTVDNDDIRINLYKNIKNIYDKWVAGVEDGTKVCAPQIEHFIDNFKFLDRAYNNIEDKFLVNPIALTEYMISDYNQSFYDYIARVLVDNNFDFIPLPTWTNFTKASGLVDIFRTYRWNDDANYENQGPVFLCMYIGARSNTLDLGPDSEYGDDGFDFTIPGDTPDDFTDDKSGDGDKVPVFLVKYGDNNQSIFKNFKLDQKEFTETDESLRIIDEIAMEGAPTTRSYLGQNLFNVYQRRSYSCEIEMMGNAMIQPLMYFNLSNIPMFKGAYTIIKVNHSIKPNTMSTKFKGVRIRKVRTKFVDESTLYMNLIGTLTDEDFLGGSVGNLSGGAGGGASLSDDVAAANEIQLSLISKEQQGQIGGGTTTGGETDVDADGVTKTSGKFIVNQNKEVQNRSEADLSKVDDYIISIPEDVSSPVGLIIFWSGNESAGNSRNTIYKDFPNILLNNNMIIIAKGGDGKARTLTQINDVVDIFSANKGVSITSTSILGHSAGGIQVFKNYNTSYKFVGLVDPSFSSHSFYTNTVNTTLFGSNTHYSYRQANWPTKYSFYEDYPLFETKVKGDGGVAEETGNKHENYTKYFLNKFKDKI